MVEEPQRSVARWPSLKRQTRSGLSSVPAHKLTFGRQIPSIEQYAMRAFASALDAVPLALAENSGLSPIETLAEVKSRQITEKMTTYGIDCNNKGDIGE